MQDKKQVKCRIITYLCGGNDLSEKFIALLKAGGLTEKDGKAIRDKLTEQLDSNYNFDLLFVEHYIEQLSNRNDCPADEMKIYRQDDEYLQLLDMHFPQTVREAVDAVIDMLSDEDIAEIKKQDKFQFGISQHFALGLFIRNHFGINQGQSKTLYSDILQISGKNFIMSDDVSGYLLDEIWEEIQRRD